MLKILFKNSQQGYVFPKGTQQENELLIEKCFPIKQKPIEFKQKPILNVRTLHYETDMKNIHLVIKNGLREIFLKKING